MYGCINLYTVIFLYVLYVHDMLHIPLSCDNLRDLWNEYMYVCAIRYRVDCISLFNLTNLLVVKFLALNITLWGFNKNFECIESCDQIKLGNTGLEYVPTRVSKIIPLLSYTAMSTSVLRLYVFLLVKLFCLLGAFTVAVTDHCLNIYISYGLYSWGSNLYILTHVTNPVVMCSGTWTANLSSKSDF
jgi:hypothetical protein